MRFDRLFQHNIVACTTILLWLVIPVNSLIAQISPGKLTQAHSHLEGISNCTACHDLGAQVSEKKCLECHKALQVRITQKKGYHSSKEIKGKSCISCHSEHHGVNFQMIRFDKKTFNHSLTGYELKGKHKINDCAQCHQPQHISDPKLKANKQTYLGLNPSCTSCHEDYHQKTLSNDCVSCHGFETFSPASQFNHQKTNYPLTGAHLTVDCASCHKKITFQGKPFQQFADVPHQNCNACHKDPHKGEFGKDCKACHQTESFHKIKAGSTFNHSLTGFELKGKHTSLDCKKCHDQREGTPGLYQEFSGLPEITCLSCHEDTHQKKLGTGCTDCHNQFSFAIKQSLPGFVHDATGYTLAGKHLQVECRDCHKGKYMTEPLPHNTCNACHSDFHNGTFKETPYQDCAECHTVESFNLSTFDLERHARSAFPLLGAHQATPCIACHFQDNQWKFRSIGLACISCHENIHTDYLPEKYIPQNDCRSCHKEDAWSSISFNHTETGFELLGRHAATTCRSCHFTTNQSGGIVQNFSNLKQTCVDCHKNIHGKQFEENGITDCKKCHGFNTFDRNDFNHDNARFKLEGAHLKVSCESCHQKEWLDGEWIVVYKSGKLQCTDCHLQ